MFNVPLLTSCNHCREKKRKCNGEKPVCSLCKAHNVPCEYRQSRRFRKRFQTQTSLPLQNIVPGPTTTSKHQQQNPTPVVGSGPSMLTQTPQPLDSPSSKSFAKRYPQESNAFISSVHSNLQQSGQNQNQQQSGVTLPNEVNALSRLLAGNMYPQTQQLPQPILQGVNTFMSPFSDPRSQTLPEWISQSNPEAAIISNLENIASAYQASPILPLQSATTPDGIFFGNLASQFMPSGNIFQQVPSFPINSQQQAQQQQNQIMPSSIVNSSTSMLGVSEPISAMLGIPNMLAQVGISPVSAVSNGGTAAYTSSPFVPHSSTQVQSLSDGLLNMRRNSSRSSSHASAAYDSDMNRVASPVSSSYLPSTSLHYIRSPSTSALSDGSPSINALPPINEQNNRSSVHSLLTDATNDSRKKRRISHTVQQPTMPSQPRQQECKIPVHYPDNFIPEIIQTYAREFPGGLSPDVLLKVMRGICSNTRTSLVNIDLELSWCMILKGIIPRILIFAYISGMARGQVIDQQLMSQLPPKFDETCYEVAVKDIPIALASPSLWSALSLHLIGRYEFQSSRYDLMMEHYEMAADIFSKTTFRGYSFPWNDVPEQLKRTFEYDYYVYTYWVGFQWHLVCSFNLDRPFNVDIDPRSLPIPRSTRGYFAPDLPCSFDLLTLLPVNSWPKSGQTENLDKVWFRGFKGPEYEGWRPSEWNKISPNYKITLNLQRMLPLGAQLYRLQCDYCEERMTLSDYLQKLHTQQELLKRWLYSLPEEFEITQDKVNQFTKAAINQQESNRENGNMLMDFKELIMIYGLYSTFMIRANRVALLGMLNESLVAPATSMHMRVFGLRDYYEAVEQGTGDIDYGSKEYDMWQKNLAFHKCRMQCYESMNILCHVVQLSFVLRLNLFAYGTTYVAIAGEMLNVLISQLGIEDKHVKWKTKTRLAHVLCLLRSLQHWAPAIYLFVYGIQVLSDPALVLEVDDSANKRHRKVDTSNGGVSDGDVKGSLTNGKARGRLDSAIGSSQDASSTTDSLGGPMEIPNPFPNNHIINLIVDDLDMSLAMFLAPAYPMLLLKIFASLSS